MSDEERGSANAKLVRCAQCGGGGGEGEGGEGEDGSAECPAAGRDGGWRCAAAELAATALLVALSCLLPRAAPHAPLLTRALASGLVVTLLVQCFDHISGAFMNPTVTLAAVVRGRVTPRAGLLYIGAQLLGSALAPPLVLLLAPPLSPAPLRDPGLTLPAQDLPLYKAVAVEAVSSACLVLANCGSWDARNRLLPDSWPLRIGLIVTLMTLLAGDLTGASMNPARSFGPALWALDFRDHWVYWVSPLSAALALSALYGALWRAPPHAPPRALPPHPHSHPLPHTPLPTK